MIHRLQSNTRAQWCTVSAALLLLSLLAGFSQIKTEGLAWQEAHYLPQLEAVLAGDAPAPGQYRLLTDAVVVAACRVASSLDLPRPVGVTFVALRIAQNLALFFLAFFFYRRLGLSAYTAVFGLSALAWGMTQANYGADLGFNTYTDIILYLGAALALLERRYGWILPLSLLAALNRETGVFIPVMALACIHAANTGDAPRTSARPAWIALTGFVAVQVGLHLALGSRPWSMHESGATPGLGYLLYNLGNDAAWGHTFGVLGIVPVLALLARHAWHPLLRPLAWSVVPAWLVLHLLFAPLDQSRVLLLPQVLVFLPAMLCGLQAFQGRPIAQTPGAPA